MGVVEEVDEALKVTLNLEQQFTLVKALVVLAAAASSSPFQFFNPENGEAITPREHCNNVLAFCGIKARIGEDEEEGYDYSEADD